MAVLSAEQVAQLAYQAGFRGADLENVVAIAKRESGYNPQAHNTNTGTGDNSYGLMQINMLGGMGPSRMQAFGISSFDQLFDPLTNLRAAYVLYQGRGGQLTDWGGYKGNANTYNTDVATARQAVANAAAQGLLGQDYQAPAGSGAAPAPGARGLSPQGGQQGGVTVKPPPDGRLVRSPWDNKLFLFYDVGGVIIDYEVPEDGSVDLSGFQETTMSREEFTATNAVVGGSALELGDVVRSYGTYSTFFDSILKRVMGDANPSRNDPGVRRIIAEFAARPDMSPTELQNRLQGTDWYQQHTEAQLQWDEKPQAEKEKLKQDMAAQMAQTWLQYIGIQLDPNDPRIVNYVEDLASGKKSYGNWIESVVKPLAQGDPESPFSRQLRDEQETRKKRGIDVEDTMQQVRQTAGQWGIKWSDDTVLQWGKDIVEKNKSQDDLLQTLKTQAQQLYPFKDVDLSTRDYASPFIETYRRVLEKDADIFNPQIQSAMTNGTPVWELEQQLKNTDEWMGTKNFRSDISSAISQAGRMMGFQK